MSPITFGQSLEQWMRQRGLSHAALARMTGVKSVTTVSRLVHDQSAPKRCIAFMDTLAQAFPDMPEEELGLLQSGLRTTLDGVDGTRAQRALSAMVFPGERAFASTPLSELLIAHTDADVYELYCIQSADTSVIEAFCQLLAAADQRVQIEHFVVAPLPLGIAEYVAAARVILCDSRYHVHYLRDVSPDSTVWHPGSMMILRTRRNQTEQQLLILPKHGGQISVMPLESADLYHFMLQATRNGMADAAPLNTTRVLTTPRACLDYLTACYERERGRACCLLRSKPNLAMVPVELLQRIYNDAHALQQTSVRDYASELRRICYLRFTNRMEHPRPTYVIFSRRALGSFMKTGLLLDHFTSLRPFTRAERCQILAHLIHQAETMPTMHLHVARQEHLFKDFFFGCYEGSGVLLSPLRERRGAASGTAPYCEAYIGDPAFAKQFQDFYLNVLLPKHAYSREESLSILRGLLAEGEGAGA